MGSTVYHYDYSHPDHGVKGTLRIGIDGNRLSCDFSTLNVAYEESGGWRVARCSAFNVIGYGTNRKEAQTHVREIIEVHLCDLLDVAGSKDAALAILRSQGWHVTERAEGEEPAALETIDEDADAELGTVSVGAFTMGGASS